MAFIVPELGYDAIRGMITPLGNSGFDVFRLYCCYSGRSALRVFSND
jgi:hypothetical protein